MTDNPVQYNHIAVMGSSFAAGPGIQPIVNKGANRSGRNYGHLLAAQRGARITDLTVSGATTATILDRPQRLGTAKFPPQIAGLPLDCDLVLITAGGNDLGYSFSMLRAGWGGWMTRRPLLAPLGRHLTAGAVPRSGPHDIARAADGLARVVAAARVIVPEARILLVDYLTVLGPDSKPSAELPLEPTTIALFREVGHALNTAFAEAARLSSAELVTASAISESHALGASQPWVVGFAPNFSGIPAFHPNEEGHRAIATAIDQHLRSGTSA